MLEPTSTNRIILSLRTVFVAFHLITFAIVNQIAPEPYIDEIFHYPQSLTYCHGKFHSWDDKITTPPGLYLVSYVIFKVGNLLILPFDLSSLTAMRFLNTFLVCFVLPSITGQLYQRIHVNATKDQLLFASVIPAFPLLSFFGNLYYTDVLSTTLVLYCYLLALKRRYVASALAGAFSALTRQTNIVWVAFVMAVSIIRDLKEVDIVEVAKEEEGHRKRGWVIFDPLAAEARFPVDYIIAVRQAVIEISGQLYAILPILRSYVPVFAGFLIFLVWNKGIVLGDKSNHIAGINMPQLLYCAVFIAGFGAPILLSVPLVFGFFRSSLSSFRNILQTCTILGLLTIVVHYNTIEHPFLRSDNRHFVFYIWQRTIRKGPLVKYLAVPIYYAASWLVLTTLSHSQSALFLLGIIACTALTIVPSPLLEFRYFVLPYLFWRLHLSPSVLGQARWRGVLEYAWYEIINLVTLWIFITRPFTWESEPGKVQRFIW